MKLFAALAIAGSLLASSALTQESCAQETPAQESHDNSAMDHGAMQGATKEYQDAMTAMDRAMRGMAMTGKPGADFAAMMIPHHEAAIAMANSYLKSGDNDPELAKMAREIVAAQEREIAVLRAWLAKNP